VYNVDISKYKIVKKRCHLSKPVCLPVKVKVKVKDKGHPRTDHEDPEGE
jgi:hypothetical protein